MPDLIGKDKRRLHPKNRSETELRIIAFTELWAWHRQAWPSFAALLSSDGRAAWMTHCTTGTATLFNCILHAFNAFIAYKSVVLEAYSNRQSGREAQAPYFPAISQSGGGIDGLPQMRRQADRFYWWQGGEERAGRALLNLHRFLQDSNRYILIVALLRQAGCQMGNTIDFHHSPSLPSIYG